MSNSVSITSVKQYIDTAMSLGVDINAVLTQCGIKPNALHDNTQRMPLSEFEQLLLLLINASDCAYFGLRCSQFTNSSTYSSLGLMSLSAPTLKNALELVPTYEPLVGDMGTTQLHPHGRDWLLSWHCNIEHPVVRRHLIEAVLSSWHRYGTQILGLETQPDVAANMGLKGVFLEHDQVFDVGYYQNVFAVTPAFGQRQNALLLPEDVMRLPMPQANQPLQVSLRQYADTELAQLRESTDICVQVQQVMQSALPYGSVSKVYVAQQLGISARSLQRRLLEEGSSYQTLLHALRERVAKQELAGSKTFDEIAQLLGFTETRSFFRYFKQRTGVTAGNYRGQLRNALNS